MSYLTNSVSMKLIDFSNIFAVKSSTPMTDQMIALALVAFFSCALFFLLMYYAIHTHWKNSHNARMMFNYLSIDTLEANEKLKNYVLYHSVNDGLLKRIHAKKKSDSEDSKVRAILNAAVDGVVVCNSSNIIEIFNPAAGR